MELQLWKFAMVQNIKSKLSNVFHQNAVEPISYLLNEDLSTLEHWNLTQITKKYFSNVFHQNGPSAFEVKLFYSKLNYWSSYCSVSY